MKIPHLVCCLCSALAAAYVTTQVRSYLDKKVLLTYAHSKVNLKFV